MVVDRAKLSSSDVAGVVGRPPAATDPGTVDAVLLGTDEDTKLLLRGLLRLYHHTVAFEARAAEELDQLVPGAGPRVLLLDAEALPGGWETAVRLALRAQPGLRPILLTVERSPDLEARARTAGVCVVLARPFGISDFRQALAAAGAGS